MVGSDGGCPGTPQEATVVTDEVAAKRQKTKHPTVSKGVLWQAAKDHRLTTVTLEDVLSGFEDWSVEERHAED